MSAATAQGHRPLGAANRAGMAGNTCLSEWTIIRAYRWYEKLGVKVDRVMTDNGSCYKPHAFAKTCRDLKINHIRTKPYTPKTNGKAERFIETTLREWANARAYNTSDERAADLLLWSHMCNGHHPHGGIKDQTQISWLGKNRDNLLRLHS